MNLMAVTGPSDPAVALQPLREAFSERLQENAPLARYTAARVGGAADAMLVAESADDLASMVGRLWEMGTGFLILGGGSNLLVSDRGVRGVVVLNRARRVIFNTDADGPSVWAESGASFGVAARQAAARGLSGLEWAAGIPGTVGGAVVGNAGAHGGDIAGSLSMAEILHLNCASKPGAAAFQREQWEVDKLAYGYRSSILKSRPGQAVVLSALLNLNRPAPGKEGEIFARLDSYTAHRRRTQPPGASMGSMFKNPPGDFAGRLIEAAGLKGARSGGAEISELHANFFINNGHATASDVLTLIRKARQAVADKFGIDLELEIELVGDWYDESL